MILYIGSGLLITAIGYIYGFKRTKRNVFTMLGVIVFCYTTAFSIPVFIKGIDYGFRGESFLGSLDTSEIRIVLAIASLLVLTFYVFIFHQFMEFIVKRDKKE